MSAPFTPGPWQWVGDDEIEQVEHPFTSVAEVVRIFQDKDAEQRCANARLIAAAPDGYEAGEEAVTALNAMMDAWFDYHDAHNLTQPVTGAAGNAFDKALAAREKLEGFIAKARGGQ